MKEVNQIQTLEDLFSKMWMQKEKLFKWYEAIKNELLIFCQKLVEDFYISKI